jgi:hypothetical protein
MGSAAAAADEEDEEIKLLQEVEGGYGPTGDAMKEDTVVAAAFETVPK